MYITAGNLLILGGSQTQNRDSILYSHVGVRQQGAQLSLNLTLTGRAGENV